MKLFAKLSALFAGFAVVLSAGVTWAKNQVVSHKFVDVEQFEAGNTTAPLTQGCAVPISPSHKFIDIESLEAGSGTGPITQGCAQPERKNENA